MENQEKKKSLVEMLRLMQDFDDGIAELKPEDIKALVGDIIPEKVDACKEFLIELEGRADIFARKIKEFQEAKKSIENQIKRYRHYLVYAMESTGSQKMPGKLYTLSISTRNIVKAVDCTLDSEEYIDLNMLEPGIVKRQYSFDMTAFKKLASENSDFAEKYAITEPNTIATFRINKEPKAKKKVEK